MRSGALRQRIVLRSQQEVQDANGDVTLDWADAVPDIIGGIPARFLPAKGREIVVGNALRHELPAKFEIRWMPGVTTDMQVLWDGSTWEVEDVMPDETGRKWLTLTVVRDGPG